MCYLQYINVLIDTFALNITQFSGTEIWSAYTVLGENVIFLPDCFVCHARFYFDNSNFVYDYVACCHRIFVSV